MTLKFFLLFVLLALPMQAVTAVPKGPKYKPYCYKTRTGTVYMGTVRLKASRITTDYINRAVHAMPMKCIGTNPWDDKWYKWRLKSRGENRFLLMFAKFITEKKKGQFHWTLIENTRKAWYVHDSKYSRKKATILRSGKQFKHSYFEDIDFDVYNPPNTNGISGNDIYYSFGFEVGT